MKNEREKTVKDVELLDRAKYKLTVANMNSLARIINSYISQKGKVPDSLKELQTFYVLSAKRIDEWGTPIKYEKLSEYSFRLISAGKDKTFNTSDDIILTF
ncbi:hypothetical protein NLB96_00750 [Candidatus Aminicenantes bacterium AC-335-K20]|jgi:hypothetical protein|nr:hypothetical protein [SCandidatus Aminicenantes bacterium Aminicenantia_JdfR_composite]MCP2605969.1 hypothetical protein [Candidatus Aminicenantes bacterium AC-708-I09]MCP2619285.1 hypothetical protein [Candidatus Aminicenantes bacterium AC-335-K20]MCP2620413.1 hypothetical protein [Candidatus Aminicenantes bacterium AC-334-E05]